MLWLYNYRSPCTWLLLFFFFHWKIFHRANPNTEYLLLLLFFSWKKKKPQNSVHFTVSDVLSRTFFLQSSEPSLASSYYTREKALNCQCRRNTHAMFTANRWHHEVTFQFSFAATCFKISPDSKFLFALLFGTIEDWVTDVSCIGREIPTNWEYKKKKKTENVKCYPILLRYLVNNRSLTFDGFRTVIGSLVRFFQGEGKLCIGPSGPCSRRLSQSL